MTHFAITLLGLLSHALVAYYFFWRLEQRILSVERRAAAQETEIRSHARVVAARAETHEARTLLGAERVIHRLEALEQALCRVGYALHTALDRLPLRTVEAPPGPPPDAPPPGAGV